MGVRKQHVKSADTLHVWIWYPPHAQAYSQTTAADFFVFWTRCQWLIKHTAYHLNTALTLFLFLIFKSPRTSILSNCWPRKKESSIGHTLASLPLGCPVEGGQPWPGRVLTMDPRGVSYTAPGRGAGGGGRADHQLKEWWAGAGGARRSWKFTFVLGLMK